MVLTIIIINENYRSVKDGCQEFWTEGCAVIRQRISSHKNPMEFGDDLIAIFP
jgi:hypothetical protein